MMSNSCWASTVYRYKPDMENSLSQSHHNKKSLVFLLLGLALLIYPLIVYKGLSAWGPELLALGLVALLLVRFVLTKAYQDKGQKWVLIGACLFLLAVILLKSQSLLLYYPSLMNLFVAMAFLFSLRAEKTLIEKMASLQGKGYPAEAIPYMRKLTLIWGLLLIANCAVAFYTACCLPLSWWTLYNGLLSYVLISLFILGELIFRYFYKKHNKTGL